MSRKRARQIFTEPDGLYLTEGTLGLGGMSDVILATCRSTGRRVALKLGNALVLQEPMEMLKDDSLHYHRLEWCIYKRLNSGGSVPGIPQAYDFGVAKMWLPPPPHQEGSSSQEVNATEDSPNHPSGIAGRAPPVLVSQLRPYLSLQLLGPSLDLLVHNGEIPPHKFLRFAEGMLTAVESLHKGGVIHRDIKPGNFCVGRGAKIADVYLVDYGFAKFYNPQTAVPRATEAFGGTPDYSSMRQLKCRTTGPADDLESLGYTWLHMLKGRTPWDTIKELDNPEAPWSTETVLKMAPARRCAWKSMAAADKIPSWLLEWMEECDRYECNDWPDYQMLQIILERCTLEMAPRATSAEE